MSSTDLQPQIAIMNYSQANMDNQKWFRQMTYNRTQTQQPLDHTRLLCNLAPWSKATWPAADQSELRRGMTSPSNLDVGEGQLMSNMARANTSYEQRKEDDTDEIENVLEDEDPIATKATKKIDRASDEHVRRRLIELLPYLMSSEQLKFLVDGGHVRLDDNCSESQTADDCHQHQSCNVRTTASLTRLSSPVADCKQATIDQTTALSFGTRDTDSNGGSDSGDSPNKLKKSMFSCHLCTYICHSKTLFDEHMLMEHFGHRCTECNYSARTAGRLQRHIEDFHKNTSREGATRRTTSSAACRRQYRCRRCENWVTDNQEDFWRHCRLHMASTQLFECPACPFATKLKHHMKYHVFCHLDINPYRCPECIYQCRNKSMLKSHRKTHDHVYRYRCASCTFAAKYQHALTQHQAKYPDHQANIVLNDDGSMPIIGGSQVADKVNMVDFTSTPLSSSESRSRPSSITKKLYRTGSVDSRNNAHNEGVKKENPLRPVVWSKPEVSYTVGSDANQCGTDDATTDLLRRYSLISSYWQALVCNPLANLAGQQSQHLMPFIYSPFLPPLPPAAAMSTLSTSLFNRTSSSQLIDQSCPDHTTTSEIGHCIDSNSSERSQTPSGNKSQLNGTVLCDEKTDIKLHDAACSPSGKSSALSWVASVPRSTQSKQTADSTVDTSGRGENADSGHLNGLREVGESEDKAMFLAPLENTPCTENPTCADSQPLDLTRKSLVAFAAGLIDSRFSASADDHDGSSERLSPLICQSVAEERSVSQEGACARSAIEAQLPTSLWFCQDVDTSFGNCSNLRAQMVEAGSHHKKWSEFSFVDDHFNKKQQTPPSPTGISQSAVRRLDVSFNPGVRPKYSCNDVIHPSSESSPLRRRDSSPPITTASRQLIRSSQTPLNGSDTQSNENVSDWSSKSRILNPDAPSKQLQVAVSLQDRQGLDMKLSEEIKCEKMKKRIKLECPCGIVYDHQDTYDIHMTLHYSVEDPFRCRLCGCRTENAVEFYLHVHRYAHQLKQAHDSNTDE